MVWYEIFHCSLSSSLTLKTRFFNASRFFLVNDISHFRFIFNLPYCFGISAVEPVCTQSAIYLIMFVHIFFDITYFLHLGQAHLYGQKDIQYETTSFVMNFCHVDGCDRWYKTTMCIMIMMLDSEVVFHYYEPLRVVMWPYFIDFLQVK